MSLPDLEKFYHQSVTVFRQKPTQDKFGGVSTTSDKVEISVSLRIWGAAGRLERTFAGKQYLPTHKAVCEPGANIEVGDRVQTPDSSFIVLSKVARRTEQIIHHYTLELHEEAR